MNASRLADVLLAIAIALQAWTLNTVVDVRERVARLEARAALASSPPAEPPRLEILERRSPPGRVQVRGEAEHQGDGDGLGVVARELLLHDPAELGDRAPPGRARAGPGVVAHQVARVEDPRAHGL